MSEELGALEDIILYLNASEPKGLYCENIETIQQALLELQSIKEANPSEALNGLESYINNIIFAKDLINQKQQLLTNITTIKQALLKAEKEHKALEIIKEHIKFDDRGIETYTYDFKNLVTKFLIRLESKDTGATFHIHLDTEEEFNLLKEVLE